MSRYQSYSDDELISMLRLSECPIIAEGVARLFEKFRLMEKSGYCTCDADWTDGTGWCDNCGKERKGGY